MTDQNTKANDLIKITEKRTDCSKALGRSYLLAMGEPHDSPINEEVTNWYREHGINGYAPADCVIDGEFNGEVALITGGASGIGKAIVRALLDRGASVINMDVNPAVVKVFSDPNYFGIQVDLTDEQALSEAFDISIRRFGGLDMLVLNAGIFPPGVRIESLNINDWKKVMSINLDPNLSVLSKSHPFLSRSPRYGRVIINASKNVLAPGAGAAAYSSSKAAVTQLGRVAALEWAKDGIRVNMIHPDQVFDTGIWTQEVLEARAKHYGLSVEQYKRRNLLGVEINSRYVGEFVAKMLGEMFEFITGAQIPIDGGSDRVV